MTLVGDGVSVMAARLPARNQPGAIKILGRLFLVPLFLMAPKWKHRNANYRRTDECIMASSHNGIFTCNE